MPKSCAGADRARLSPRTISTFGETNGGADYNHWFREQYGFWEGRVELSGGNGFTDSVILRRPDTSLTLSTHWEEAQTVSPKTLKVHF